MNIYQDHGFKNRVDYLNNLAEEYGAPIDMVYALAYLLGEREDFDRLVIILENCYD